MRNYWHAIRTFDRSIWAYFGMWCVIGFANFGVIGVLQNLYLLRLGYDVDSIGLLIGWGQLVWAIAAFPAAAIGRRIGPKRALMLSLVLSMVGFALFFAVEAVPVAYRTAWLFIWVTPTWLAAALFLVNTTPYLAGITTEADRSYAFSIQSAILPLMSFAGGLFAGVLPGLFAQLSGESLEQPGPFRYGLWLVPPSYALALLIFWRARGVALEEESAAQAQPTRVPLAPLAVFGLIAILQSIGDGVITTFFNIYLDRGLGVPVAEIGVIVAFGSLLPVVAALATAPIMQRLGAGRTFGFATAGLSGFLAILAALPTVLMAALSRMGAGVMLSMSGPSRNVLSQEIVAPRWRTTSSAVSTVALALGWALAAAAGGAIIRVSGYSALFAIGSAISLASAALALAFARRR